MIFDLSIIVPCFNAEIFIEKFIDLHLDNAHSHRIEFIFVDDQSVDNTYEKLNLMLISRKNTVILQNKINIGPGATRAKAALIAKSDWLAFVDIDDEVIIEDKLEIQLKNMKKNNYLWSYSQWARNGKLQLEQNHTIENIKTVMVSRYIALSSTVINKELFLKNCHKMIKFSYSCEDYALWIELIKHNHLPFFETKTIMNYNIGQNNLSKNKLRQIRNVFRVYIDAVGLTHAIIYLLTFIKGKLKFV